MSVSALMFLCATGIAIGSEPGLRFSGRVMYRGTKAAAPGVLVEIVEAEDDGKPTDEVLGTTRADAAGRFSVMLTKKTNDPIALTVSAVRSSAESHGDRREKGYEVNSHRTMLGFLSNPNPSKPNTILIERHKPRHASEDDDD